MFFLSHSVQVTFYFISYFLFLPSFYFRFSIFFNEPIHSFCYLLHILHSFIIQFALFSSTLFFLCCLPSYSVIYYLPLTSFHFFTFFFFLSVSIFSIPLIPFILLIFFSIFFSAFFFNLQIGNPSPTNQNNRLQTCSIKRKRKNRKYLI